MKHKNYPKKLIYFSFLAIFLLSNCTQDNLVEDETEIERSSSLQITPVVEKLIEMGYKVENIRELENFYLVEGDLMFSKNIDDYLIKDNDNSLSEKHASTNNLVSMSNVSSMTVFVDPSIPTSGEDNWRTEIGQALEDWNSISESCINFILSTDPNSDIVVKSDNNSLDYDVIAAAWFPSNGNPHDEILINLDFNFNMIVSSSQKRYNVVHELGHCIGFRHTNWDIRGEEAGNIGANYIPGTPSQDPNSVMNGGTALNEWNGFSVYDMVAARYLYNCPEPVPEINSANGDILGRNSALSSCSSTSTAKTYYFQKNSVWTLAPGDIIYTNIYGARLNGGNKWYKISLHSFKIDSNGVIVDVDDCGFPV